MNNSHVLIVGAGSGLGASLARRFHKEGYTISVACRNTNNIADICKELNAQSYVCDVADQANICDLFRLLDEQKRTPGIVVYNAGFYDRGAITKIELTVAQKSLNINAIGAFLVAREATKRMLNNGEGTLLFTGASAGIKGHAESVPFAMGKFALRGLCQSLARELAPRNIHVAHCIIDGLIYSKKRGAPYDNPLTTLDPDAVADTYLSIAHQHRSAWTWEFELRPSTEIF